VLFFLGFEAPGLDAGARRAGWAGSASLEQIGQSVV
jgi:hypothetical protein